MILVFNAQLLKLAALSCEFRSGPLYANELVIITDSLEECGGMCPEAFARKKW